jgi:hypothetical protein
MRMRWENGTGGYWHSTYESAKHTLNTRQASNLILSGWFPRHSIVHKLALRHMHGEDHSGAAGRAGRHNSAECFAGQVAELPDIATTTRKEPAAT